MVEVLVVWMDPQNMGPVVVPDMVFGGFGGLFGHLAVPVPSSETM